jgi:PAS domain S-box-containing protein
VEIALPDVIAAHPYAVAASPGEHDSLYAARYRALADALPHMSWIASASGELRDDSPSWRAYTGQTMTEVFGLGYQQAIDPSDRRRLIAAWGAAHSDGRPFQAEQRVRGTDGVYRTFLAHVVPVFDDEGTVREWMGVYTDMTAQKAAEDAHHDLLARERAARAEAEIACTRAEDAAGELRTILDILPVGVAIVDKQGHGLRRNKALERLRAKGTPYINGMDRYDELRGWWPDGRPLRAEEWAMTRTLLNGEVVTGQEIEMESVTGERRTILNNSAPIRDASGEIVRGVVVALDITERRRVERMALDRARQFAATLEAMTDGVIVNGPDGEIIHTNTALRQMLGLDPTGEVFEHDVQDLIASIAVRDAEGNVLPSSWTASRALTGETISSAHAVEGRFEDGQGKKRIVLMSASPIRDETGRIRGAVSLVRDSTEQQKMQAERERMYDLVPHELRAPITGLLLLTHLLRTNVSQGKPVQDDDLERMDRGLWQLHRLVNDLMDAGALHAGKVSVELAPCDLKQLCEQVVEEQRAATGRAIKLDLSKRAVEVRADAQRITQVLTNLLTNAIKHSPATRRIVLKVRREPEMLRVSVQDGGEGIPHDALAHIFERYYQVRKPDDPFTGGLGLGLYICQELIAQHGGHIFAESVVGKGTTVWFTLPRVH